MTFSKFNHVKITAISGVVPKNCIDIDSEIEYYNNDVKKLERNKKILGLGVRHVVEEGVGNIDLAEFAVKKLIEECEVDISDIDALVYASSYHDYPYPASSCILHGKLNLPETCSCFDYSGLACSGYGYDLWSLSSMIESGAIKKCLFVAADTGSLHTNPKNRNVCILFGDGAVATLLEYTEEENPSYFLTGTNGKGWDKIVAPFGGAKLPIRKDIADLEIVNENGDVWHLWEDILKGFEVFKYTAIVGPKGIDDILSYADKTKEDIDFFAIHQANKQIVDTIGRHSQLPKDKFSANTFSNFGNCGIASVGMNIVHNLYNKLRKNVLLATFGIGLSYSFAILNLENTKIAKVNYYETPKDNPTRKEQIDYWIEYYKNSN